MAESNVLEIKDFKLPSAPGEHYRLLCMTGKNKGISYFLKSKRVVLGRGKETDIQVYDEKSSREHAELTLIKGSYIITDLGSQNGVIVNDLKVTQHRLRDGDKIIIGQTVYKYSRIEVQPPKVVEEEDEEYEDEEYEEVEEESTGKSALKGPKKNKVIIFIILGVLVVGFLFLGESDKKPKKKKSGIKDEIRVGFGVKKGADLDKDLKIKVNAIIHRGLRELREKNFFRAIAEFNLALVLNPNDGRASFYLNKAKQNLDDEIEQNFLKAKRDMESLRYRSAIVSYCAIIRLLRAYPDDKRFLDAKANIEVVEEKLGLDKGEVKCI